jgi:hypothetical protein
MSIWVGAGGGMIEGIRAKGVRRFGGMSVGVLIVASAQGAVAYASGSLAGTERERI